MSFTTAARSAFRASTARLATTVAGSAFRPAAHRATMSGFSHQAAQKAFKRVFQQEARRFQSTAAEQPAQSWFKRMWDSPVGLKTVHFWAPVMKWSLVLAGISDFARPVENISATQQFALMCTGVIWTRWCFIIKPRNMLLAAVNFFVGLVAIIQLGRIAMWQQSQKDKKIEEAEAVPVKA
ncbi:Mitochondrial pyruvate carrier 2 [Ceratocystis fimbriata CBS 114723]|uniref:Mitochondrial pyruvate carrier n=1 Tax=Ceratocystis fimbriata CBS 114723 TaxID=1035309 RepID=A0A2C5WWS5_9PEZI|nr:Mitochondrial pyruvate carrier 2 [Ceratocystis fimbriata CBS 114723]